MNERLTPFWAGFLAATGRPKDTAYAAAYSFDLTEKSAAELLALVLQGRKKATASSKRYFESTGEPLPKVGDLCILLDWQGNPRCVVETQAVTILPLRDMTFDLCSHEGEDASLESWQENHTRFFTAEGQQLGYAFSWDMPVVFEDFRLVYAP